MRPWKFEYALAKSTSFVQEFRYLPPFPTLSLEPPGPLPSTGSVELYRVVLNSVTMLAYSKCRPVLNYNIIF